MQARVLETNLFDYFHERVEDARTARGGRLSPDTGLYLANLLVDRARTDRPAPAETTLAELHARAAHAAPTEQARTYRELGDRTLYVLGYFAASLRRKTVGPSYYAAMGAAAYHRLDHVLALWFSRAFGEVFDELARHFDTAVAVVDAVREQHRADRPDDLPFLYEQWLATGDPTLAARLRAAGLIVGSPPRS